MKGEKTYYLFGEDAVNAYDNGIDELIEEVTQNDIAFATFEFIEGETQSADLMYEFNGWMDYSIMTEEDYNKLNDAI